MSAASPDPDIPAYCRGLALQQVEMLTRIAELGMRMVEAEGARTIAAQTRAAAETAEPGSDAAAEARAEAQEAGLAFGRFARTVQHALAQRARAADRLCAHDRADRKARRARQRNHVTEALYALIWDPAQSTEELDEADHRTTDLHQRLDALYEDEEDRVEDRPVGSVIAGLACGLGLSDEWRRRAADWSFEPHPPPPTGTPDESKARRRARLAALVKRTLDAMSDRDKASGLEAGLAARLAEPDVEDLVDAEPPARAAARLCNSLGIDFAGSYEAPEAPDTG